MYAIIETGGKQYRVAANDTITVEKLNAEAGATLALDKVLLLADGDGDGPMIPDEGPAPHLPPLDPAGPLLPA